MKESGLFERDNWHVELTGCRHESVTLKRSVLESGYWVNGCAKDCSRSARQYSPRFRCCLFAICVQTLHFPYLIQNAAALDANHVFV